MRYKHDAADSATRRASVEAYIARNLLTDDTFICRHCAASCRPSAEAERRTFVAGEMPHIGDHYSLVDGDGKPIRIVVMAQERGVSKASAESGAKGRRGASSVSIADRTKSIQAQRIRGVRRPQSHINGTVFGLMLMLGLDVHGYRESIDVDGDAIHVLDAFVLTNSTLCSALDSNGKGRATAPMSANCVEHAESMLTILAPTHLVLQGAAARMAVSRALGTNLEVNKSIDITLGGQPVRVISLHHPTSQGATNWSGPNREYFRGTVTKLLASA